MFRGEAFVCFVTLFLFWSCANALLSPKGINFEGKLQIFVISFKNLIVAYFRIDSEFS